MLPNLNRMNPVVSVISAGALDVSLLSAKTVTVNEQLH